MKRILLAITIIFGISGAYAQTVFPNFNHTNVCDYTEIKSQGRTGTCWSFSASSFIESEFLRINKIPLDISEIYTVRNIYVEKAEKYIRYHGTSNFSQGSLGHDVLNAIVKYGVIPESEYSGLVKDSVHNHSALEKELKNYLDQLLKNKPIPSDWKLEFNSIMDKHLGVVPTSFKYKGNKYSPETFASKFLKIDPNNYIGLTSFNFKELYSSFVIPVPDNFSDESYVNITLDELIEVMNYSCSNGYGIEWDGDVSESGFNVKYGVALNTNDSGALASLPKLPIENKSSSALRQAKFDDQTTTDDHLMHIVGNATSDDGRTFYITKNSWGERAGNGGLMYMSEEYVRMKTICIIVNKEALPQSLKVKIQKFL